MDEKFDIQKYLSGGVEQVVKDALQATLRDPRESAFLGKFAIAAAKASKKRTAEGSRYAQAAPSRTEQRTTTL